MGYGVKASYGSDGDNVDIVMFHAQDDEHSIHYIPDSLGVLPQENLVLSIGAGKTLFEHFVLKAELATSAITRDIRAEKDEQSQVLAKAKPLYTSRTSSSYYKAFKAAFNYQQDGYTLGVGYERVDPQYRTLGAYYFNSDLENITLNGAASIFQGKMNIAVSAGTQRDNLDKSKGKHHAPYGELVEYRLCSFRKTEPYSIVFKLPDLYQYPFTVCKHQPAYAVPITSIH